MPGRYAKNEMSSGFLDAIGSYLYRSPASLASPAASDNAGGNPEETTETTQPEPLAVNNVGVKNANP
jgi:hypothetical protein